MNFKKRFLEALPEVPAGIDIGLGEFVTYDKSTLTVLERESSDFLHEVGMPVCASPFLNFNSYSSYEISELYELEVLTESYYPIGSNGSGDILAIDIKSNEIVYFNHDCNNERVFINSSLDKLAESLCIFQLCLTNSCMNQCSELIRKVDPSAIQVNTMWFDEIQSEMESS
ncbi:hypothetical protein [Vibrio fortis]|uniref:hypothetical protein n=1 Tax=Vibrio fortis TaxID=212667 RepID=UPI0038CD4D9E